MANLEPEIRSDVWTVPNGLCVFRAVGSLGLIPLALVDLRNAVLVLYLVLAATDLVDGAIARRFNQRSKIGPRLDSIADVTMYSCLALSILVMRRDVFADAISWIVIAIASYFVAGVTSLVKFRCLPSYHNWSAKAGFFVAILASISLLLDGPVWPLRVAFSLVTIANMESLAITLRLAEPRQDVRSVFDA
ncbi:MAG: CDP-alcohol phosphatidyltransferase family protein [Rubripirellula sp.]|nr:CDP-alcohol phosphatidyltransferase family protein [Rubripirellula sp.]